MPLRLRSLHTFLLCVCLFLFASPAFTQTTSLSNETSNNTSACSASGQTLQNYCYANFNGLTDHCAKDPNTNNNCDPDSTHTFILPAGPARTIPASNTFTVTTVPAPGNISRVKLQEVLYPGTPASQVTTQVVCHWQPWWDQG